MTRFRPLMNFREIRSVYQVAKVTNEIVYIIDCFEDNSEAPMKTVTNDAENVCLSVNRLYPGKRIIYRDTDGRWDELIHDEGTFSDYKPATAPEGT